MARIRIDRLGTFEHVDDHFGGGGPQAGVVFPGSLDENGRGPVALPEAGARHDVAPPGQILEQLQAAAGAA